MMLKFPWGALAPIVCVTMISACAGKPRTSPVAPPRLALPQTALEPCGLATLGPHPILADLEVAYLERGRQIVACDASRRLLIQTIEAERGLQDRWSRLPR